MDKTYITDLLGVNAARFPDKLALIFGNKTYTWQELHDKVEQLAFVFAEQLPADRQALVGLFMPNSDRFLLCYLAILQAGHIAVPFDPNFKALEVQNVIDQLKPEFTITHAKATSLFRPSDKIQLETKLLATKPTATDKAKFVRTTPQTLVASMLFTSGTTGNPKAVPYTHFNHLWNIGAVSDLWQWTSDDTILLSLPLSHWHGLIMGVAGALTHANTLYLHERFDAEATVKALRTGEITLFMHVPIAYSKLVEYAEGTTFDISKVRLCISGSSYLPPKLWQQFKERYGQDILERYGANEMGLIASNTLDTRIPGCVGKLLKDVTVEVSEDGEIAMNSPGLFPGYWKNDEATAAQRTDNGLWLSGDIGEFDKEGRLHLKGRVQEKMKKQGYTVYPRDVEWAIMQHPKVQEAAVLSVQHPDSLSDEFVYFVVGDATEEEIRAFAKTEMPSFWRPDTIVHLDALPRTGRTSKPAIKELRAMLEQQSR